MPTVSKTALNLTPPNQGQKMKKLTSPLTRPEWNEKEKHNFFSSFLREDTWIWEKSPWGDHYAIPMP